MCSQKHYHHSLSSKWIKKKPTKQRIKWRQDSLWLQWKELLLQTAIQDPWIMNNISVKLCCLIFNPWYIPLYIIFLLQKKWYLWETNSVWLWWEGEREWMEERPLLSAAIQWVTELFKFIEKVPPFSATILCKDSRELDGGTLTKSVHVKESCKHGKSKGKSW